MTAISSVVSTPESGPKASVRCHPLASYFVLAYALTWLLVIPIMFSQMGLGIIVHGMELLPTLVITLAVILGWMTG